MSDPEVDELWRAACSQSDACPKALANFLFRSIAEDARVKYCISPADMSAMCKKAVDRAAVLLSVFAKPEYRAAFLIWAFGCEGWDGAELSEDAAFQLEWLSECARALRRAPPARGDSETA